MDKPDLVFLTPENEAAMVERAQAQGFALPPVPDSMSKIAHVVGVRKEQE